MRFIGLILFGLSFLTQPAGALEVEEFKRYEGTGERVLRVISTADLALFSPFVEAFQRENPAITVEYSVVSSAALYRAINEGEKFDVAISSAMDLQFKLVNDGLTQGYTSLLTNALPDWARWRDQIFAFTTEPAVVVLSLDHFKDLQLPETRQELLTILRYHQDRFLGAVGTYDVRESGLGYLFATQEARSTDAYWRLSEVMGRLEPKLYCCSGQMINDVADGRLALAYNVLGSYAAEQLSEEARKRVRIVQMQDFSNVILRTAIITSTSKELGAAGAFIDTLAASGLNELPGKWPLPHLYAAAEETGTGFGPIRLGPALMVYLDPLNRRAFLEEWENAMDQKAGN